MLYFIHRQEMSYFTTSADFPTQFFKNVMIGLIQAKQPTLKKRAVDNPREINFFPISTFDESDNIQTGFDGIKPPYRVKEMRGLLPRR
jgi:hypothetical protein